MIKGLRTWAIIGLVAVLLVGLAGCKVDRFTKEIGKEIGNQVAKNSGAVQAEQGFEQNQAASGLSGLEIQNAVGNIEVAGSDEAELAVKATVVIRGADSEKTAKVILETMELTQEGRDGTAFCGLTVNGEPLADALKELKNKYGNSLAITVDYAITLPQTITDYSLTTGVGNLLLTGVTVSGKLTSGVGNISLAKAILTDHTTISAGTGNVHLEAEQIEQAQAVTVDVGVGDIGLDVPGEAGYTLDINAFMNERVNKDIGGGGTLFKLTTGVGNVKVNGNEVN